MISSSSSSSKLTGDGEFDAGRVFGFDSHKWKEMMKFSALMNSKGTNYKNWEDWCSQYGILIEFENFSKPTTTNMS